MRECVKRGKRVFVKGGVRDISVVVVVAVIIIGTSERGKGVKG